MSNIRHDGAGGGARRRARVSTRRIRRFRSMPARWTRTSTRMPTSCPASATPATACSGPSEGSDGRTSSSPSIKAPPRPARFCSTSRANSRRSRKRNCHRSSRRPGWVEHDPEEIWRAVQQVCPRRARPSVMTSTRQVPSASPTSARPRWCGTARPASRSTTRSCGRTAAARRLCRKLIDEGWEPKIQAKTGLADRLILLRDQGALDPRQRRRARRRRRQRGELAMGTIDCFVLWRLTGGKVHATDVTNASAHHAVRHPQAWIGTRTCWSCSISRRACCRRSWRAPTSSAPAMTDTIGVALPIAGIAGDQQAALIGQACFKPGMIKSTYGTGCFALLNTGGEGGEVEQPAADHGRLQDQGRTGLCDRRQHLRRRCCGAVAARRAEADPRRRARPKRMARSIAGTNGVYLVPAFTGLGAPYWDPTRARCADRPDPRHRHRGDRAIGAGSGVLPDPRSHDARWRAMRARHRRACCASMAAWRATIG